MARVLGRHGIQDGYTFAIEHIADPGMTQLAADALAAIRDDRTRVELWRVLETSHDRNWNTAALAGLAAVKDARVKPRLFEILKNPRDPLLVAAATAAGDLGDAEALPLLGPLAASRNSQVAQAALRAVGALAPQAERKAIANVAPAVLGVLHDPDADQQLRLAALENQAQWRPAADAYAQSQSAWQSQAESPERSAGLLRQRWG
jgi:HEAT repeat protein